MKGDGRGGVGRKRYRNEGETREDGSENYKSIA